MDNCAFVVVTGDDIDKVVFCLLVVSSIVAVGVISGRVSMDNDIGDEGWIFIRLNHNEKYYLV